jgi:hypothetical protein
MAQIELKSIALNNGETLLIYLENCGHSPLVDDLDQLLQRVTEFLDS